MKRIAPAQMKAKAVMIVTVKGTFMKTGGVFRITLPKTVEIQKYCL